MAQNPKVAKLVMEFVDVFPNDLPKVCLQFVEWRIKLISF